MGKGVNAWVAAVVVGLASMAAMGQEAAKPAAAASAEKDRSVTTEHEVAIGGKVVKYKATAGLMPLMDDQQKVKARIFYVAYEKVEGEDPARVSEPSRGTRKSRPITFAFNGGPGSSSVWLHMGALGPRRVVMGPEGEMPARGGAELTDNEASWLDFTDLVFIDPVSTGYSRPVEGEDAKQFHGLDEDVRAVGEFIRIYLVRAQRWLSPKYLAGESYGTTRAAGLAGELQGKLGVYLDGIVLISPVLNFQTLDFDNGNDTPYWLFLPTYTSTAFYHKQLKAPLDADLSKAVAESERWAQGEYLTALAKGDRLSAAERDAVAAKYAELTGLSAEFVKRSNLRVHISAFTKELLRDSPEGARTVGRLDSRYKGIDRNAAGATTEYDPSYAAIQGPFTAALNGYVRGELNFESDVNYEILTGNVRPWNYPARNKYADVSETLRAAMSQNPNLRVLSCSGYYDLATPHFAIQYTIAHMGLEPSQRERVSQTFYESGHMMYIRHADLVKQWGDVKAFYGEGK